MRRPDFLHANASHLPLRGRPFVDTVLLPSGSGHLDDETHALYDHARRGSFQPQAVAVAPVEEVVAPVAEAPVSQKSWIFEEAERRVRAQQAQAAAQAVAPTHVEAPVTAQIPVRVVARKRRASRTTRALVSLIVAAALIDGALIALTDMQPVLIVAWTALIVAAIVAARKADAHYRLHLGSRLRATGRFALTTAVVFGLLFVSLNASSYWDRAQYFFRGGNTSADTQQEKLLAQLLPGRDAASPSPAVPVTTPGEIPEEVAPVVDLSTPLAARQEPLTLKGFAVSPPDDRLIIPKLGKNVPIVHTTDTALLTQDWANLEKQIQTDLQRGVVHYPGTANPGEIGNVFLTGHSSYYPWDPGRYKSVFALLDQLVVGDQVILYSRGEKYVYTASDVMVVPPERSDVLSQPKTDSILTLMTCTPVGTAKDRLIIRFRQVSPDPSTNRAPTANDGSRIGGLAA